MTKFAIKKKIDLGFLGSEWEQCYITLVPLAVKEFEKIQRIAPKDENDAEAGIEAMNAMLDIVREHFVEGKSFDGTSIVSIDRDDISDLPMEILTLCINSLAGKADPKS